MKRYLACVTVVLVLMLWIVLPGSRSAYAEVWSEVPPGVLSRVLSETQASATEAPQDARSQLKAGVLAFQQGDYIAAVAAFSESITQDSTLTAAYTNRCLANLQLSQYQAAVEDCSTAIDQNPRLIEAYLNRGLAHHRQGKFAAAIADYSQLLQMQPIDFRAYYNRGLSQMALQAYREAIVDFGEAARQVSPFDHGTLAEILTDRGLAQLLQTNLDQAIADFTAAVQLDRSAVRAYYNRGCAHHQQGNAIAAVADFTEVLNRVPDDAQALLNRGMIHRDLGETIAAIQDLQQAADCFCHQGMMLAYHKTLELLDQIRFVGMAIAFGAAAEPVG